MELTLTEQEQEFLSNILEQCHRVLLEEIAHTDRRAFREGLRKNEKILESLMSRFQVTTVPGPPRG